ncbi:hypothetical protein Trydic_g13059 [Trypoxylus dichotomus]
MAEQPDHTPESVIQDEIMKREIDLLKREMELFKRQNALLYRDSKTEKNGFGMQDLRSSRPVFGENQNYPVEKWISDLEENCLLYGWNAAQMLICAETLFCGAAKICWIVE